MQPAALDRLHGRLHGQLHGHEGQHIRASEHAGGPAVGHTAASAFSSAIIAACTVWWAPTCGNSNSYITEKGAAIFYAEVHDRFLRPLSTNFPPTPANCVTPCAPSPGT